MENHGGTGKWINVDRLGTLVLCGVPFIILEVYMSIYSLNTFKETLGNNEYPGRGIVIGKTHDGKKAAIAYFIMGRSENSRNRVFVEEGSNITIYPYDESKVEDPSLIIYSPIRVFENKVIVTNGNQTDTIYEHLEKGKCFKHALDTREFEPDGPTFTPRISGILYLGEGDFCYDLSILKSADEKGSACNRYYFQYKSIPGVGHMIHTYNHNGNPIPTFTGEPKRMEMIDDIDDFTCEIWNDLNEDNKISLVTKFIDLETGETETRVINKFTK